MPPPNCIVCEVERMSESNDNLGEGIVHYHEDGQTVTRLTKVWAVTIDGEGIVTIECQCISHIGELYSQLCQNCEDHNMYMEAIESECSPNCQCKLINHWENLKDEDKVPPYPHYPFFRYLCPFCLQNWEQLEKLDDFRKYCAECLSKIGGSKNV